MRALLEIGIQPDIIVCRTDRPLGTEIKRKIGLFCNVRANHVITAEEDQDCIYQLPLSLHAEGLDDRIVDGLSIWCRKPDLSAWESVVAITARPKAAVKIAIVGKYVDLMESYKSLNEALRHGGVANACTVDLSYIDAEALERPNCVPAELLGGYDAVLVPGGFGSRGIEGKLRAVQYARESGTPFFGICLGMQCAVIEYSRNVLGLVDANSTEFNESTANPVIHLMEGQKNVTRKGGTMRLGAYPALLTSGSWTHAAYDERRISERHRHRYEFNNAFRASLDEAGMQATGVNPDLDLVEVVEVPSHPWFVGVQFHPEFKSKPLVPHPLFSAFIKAGLEARDLKVSADASSAA